MGSIMLDAGIRPLNSIKNGYMRLFLLLCLSFTYHSHSLYGNNNNQTLTYYLYITDFAQSFIEIPTSNVSNGGSTISSTYLAGRAAIYNNINVKVGTCSAS